MTAPARSTLYVAPALLAVAIAGQQGVPAAVPAVALAAAVLGAVAMLLARVAPDGAGPTAAAAGGYAVLGMGLAAAVLAVTIPAAGDRAFATAALPVAAGFPLADGVSSRRGAGTLGVLALPLVAGVAVATAAAHLPAGVAADPDARTALLRLACGVLLAGAYALLLVLAVQGRLALAAVLAAWPVLLAAVTAGAMAVGYLGGCAAVPQPHPESLVQWSDAMLPATVWALTAVHVIGLVAAAYTLLDGEAG